MTNTDTTKAIAKIAPWYTFGATMALICGVMSLCLLSMIAIFAWAGDAENLATALPIFAFTAIPMVVGMVIVKVSFVLKKNLYKRS